MMNDDSYENDNLSPQDLIQLVVNNEQVKLREVLLKDKDGTLIYDTKDWSGDGLLAIASWNDRLEIAEMLIDEFQADVNARNKSNLTPLHRACYQGSEKMIRLLCSKGADLFAKDDLGLTPGDCGSEDVRMYIQEKVKVYKAIQELKLQEMEAADREWDRKLIEEEELKAVAIVRANCSRAVPVCVLGAINDLVNGFYDPIPNSIHCYWPVYLKRDSYDMVLIYNSFSIDNDNGEWLIQHIADLFYQEVYTIFNVTSYKDLNIKKLDPSMSFVRLSMCPSNFPELRVNGKNGIIEYEIVNGIFQPITNNNSNIEIVTIAYLDGIKKTEELKNNIYVEEHDFDDSHSVDDDEDS